MLNRFARFESKKRPFGLPTLGFIIVFRQLKAILQGVDGALKSCRTVDFLRIFLTPRCVYFAGSYSSLAVAIWTLEL